MSMSNYMYFFDIEKFIFYLKTVSKNLVYDITFVLHVSTISKDSSRIAAWVHTNGISYFAIRDPTIHDLTMHDLCLN